MKLEFGTVIGFFDTTLNAVSVEAKRRGGKLVSLDVHGQLNGKQPLAARIEIRKGQPRELLAEATDAGAAFRLVGFYPSARGGEVSLRSIWTHRNARRWVLYARNFVIANDQVVGEVLSGPRAQKANVKVKAQPQYSDQLQFDRMRVPFSVGYGQFILHDAAINGPLLGATLRGSIDFKREQINVSGTYVPLYGLRRARRNSDHWRISPPHGECVFGHLASRARTRSPTCWSSAVDARARLSPAVRILQSLPHTSRPSSAPEPENGRANGSRRPRYR